MSFINKVVVITGASSGVGAAAAIHLSKLLAKLVLVGRRADKLHEVAELCVQGAGRSSGLTPLVIVADVSRDEDAERIVSTTRQHYGRIDVLVNNAGVGRLDNILTLSMETYDEVMNTNLRAVFNLTRLAVPSLIESKGNIINISSTMGVKPAPHLLSYSVAKAALEYFTRTIAMQLGPKKVRANSVVLGYARTEMTSGMDAELQERTINNIPTRSPVELEEVSQLIEYLASDAAKSITGHYVAIDGGMSFQ